MNPASVDIRRISYAVILDCSESNALLAEYAMECSIPEIGTPKPQRAVYADMERIGLMHSFGVFADDLLVGFATLLVFVLPHYGAKVANVESLFLARSGRRGDVGKRLMAHIENEARAMKCVGVLYNARAGSRLERLLSVTSKYKRTNSVFLWSAA